MSEQWLPVVGYEGYYEVSDQGRIRSLDRVAASSRGSRHIKGQVLVGGTKSGYRRLVLCKLGTRKTFSVHALILTAFVGPRPDGLEACHADGNKLNNALVNLRWDTHAANSLDQLRHGTHSSASKASCPQGHPYEGDNLLIIAGWRRCRVCKRETNNAHYRRNAEVVRERVRMARRRRRAA